MAQAAATDPQIARPALAELFQQYQRPLLAVARIKGLSQEDAADAVQEFFCDILEDNWLQNADQERGRFRAFLSVSWKRFLVDHYRKQTAAKRGGAKKVLSLDPQLLTGNWEPIISGGSNVDDVFLREWAEALIHVTKQEVLSGYVQRGKGELAEQLFPYLTRSLDKESLDQVAHSLFLSSTAVKVALHRLRSRFAEMLRCKVAETVVDPAEIDAELDVILSAL